MADDAQLDDSQQDTGGPDAHGVGDGGDSARPGTVELIYGPVEFMDEDGRAWSFDPDVGVLTGSDGSTVRYGDDGEPAALRGADGTVLARDAEGTWTFRTAEGRTGTWSARDERWILDFTPAAHGSWWDHDASTGHWSLRESPHPTRPQGVWISADGRTTAVEICGNLFFRTGNEHHWQPREVDESRLFPAAPLPLPEREFADLTQASWRMERDLADPVTAERLSTTFASLELLDRIGTAYTRGAFEALGFHPVTGGAKLLAEAVTGRDVLTQEVKSSGEIAGGVALAVLGPALGQLAKANQWLTGPMLVTAAGKVPLAGPDSLTPVTRAIFDVQKAVKTFDAVKTSVDVVKVVFEELTAPHPPTGPPGQPSHWPGDGLSPSGERVGGEAQGQGAAGARSRDADLTSGPTAAGARPVDSDGDGQHDATEAANTPVSLDSEAQSESESGPVPVDTNEDGVADTTQAASTLGPTAPVNPVSTVALGAPAASALAGAVDDAVGLSTASDQGGLHIAHGPPAPETQAAPQDEAAPVGAPPGTGTDASRVVELTVSDPSATHGGVGSPDGDHVVVPEPRSEATPEHDATAPHGGIGQPDDERVTVAGADAGPANGPEELGVPLALRPDGPEREVVSPPSGEQRVDEEHAASEQAVQVPVTASHGGVGPPDAVALTQAQVNQQVTDQQVEHHAALMAVQQQHEAAQLAQQQAHQHQSGSGAY